MSQLNDRIYGAYLDQVDEMVKQNPEWVELERRVLEYLARVPDSEKVQEKLLSLIDRQCQLQMRALFELLT